MGDNDLTVTLSAKVDQALAGLDKVGSKIDALTDKQNKLKQSSEGFGAKTVLAFEAVHQGAEKALEFAEKVAHAIAEIDKNLANLSRRGGASNISLSQSLGQLGLSGKDLGNAQGTARSVNGTQSQGEIDAFVASLRDTAGPLSGKQASQLISTYARGASVIGDPSALGELQHIFGSQLGGADIGDLAVKYGRAVPGGFTGANAKGVHELIGAGQDPFQALGISAAFNKVGEKKAVSAAASYLEKGGSLEDLLSGKPTGEPTLDRAVAAILGSGGGLGSINADAQGFRGVTQSDVIGEALEGQTGATKREVELRRGARSYEVNRNLDADAGVGAGAREAQEQVEDAISSLEASGTPSGMAQATALRAQVEKFGYGYAASGLSGTNRVQNAAASTGRDLANQLTGGLFGIVKPLKVEIHNQNPTGEN